MAQCRFARRSLEQKCLIGKTQGIAMQQVDFHLSGAGFMNQGIDLDVPAPRKTHTCHRTTDRTRSTAAIL